MALGGITVAFSAMTFQSVTVSASARARGSRHTVARAETARIRKMPVRAIDIPTKLTCCPDAKRMALMSLMHLMLLYPCKNVIGRHEPSSFARLCDYRRRGRLRSGRDALASESA